MEIMAKIQHCVGSVL